MHCLRIDSWKTQVLLCFAVLLLLPLPVNASSGTPEIQSEEQTLQRREIVHEGLTREYFVHVPAQATDKPLPVVLALHGYGTTATGLAAIYALNEHSDRNGYIVVYPQGTHFMGVIGDDPSADPMLVTTWNDLASNFTPTKAGPHCTQDRLKYPCPPECGQCNRCDWVSCYDDKGFLLRLLDDVEQEFHTDIDRYYLLGSSNGAMMAIRLSCEMGERFAAVAALLAQMPPGHDCAPDVSLPLFHLYGERDDNIGHDGSSTSYGWIFTSAADNTETWARGINCKGPAKPWRTEITDANNLVCEAYTNCGVAEHQVVSCMDPEAGHEWRGQRLLQIPANCVSAEQKNSLPNEPDCQIGEDSSALWGMDMVWQFLSQYHRTGS